MNNNVINIVKILNFPVENNQSEEIDVNFQLEENKDSYRLLDNIDIEALIGAGKIYHSKNYGCDELFVLDEKGGKYTFCDCSFWCNARGFTTYIDFAFNSIISGNHIKDMKNKPFDKIELKINYQKPLNFKLNCNDVKVELKPNYKNRNLSREELEWIGEENRLEFDKTIDLTLIGNNTFKEYDKILWRLSEFMLLYYEDMFSYDTFRLYKEGQVYKYKSFMRSNDIDSRKSNLKTSNATVNSYCSIYYDDIEKHFNKFVIFREDSGIIFDVFRSTIYSKSFREDYPLRLSQVMEGLANYLNIADTNKRRDSFNTAIQLSLYCNDYIKEQLPTLADIQKFAKKITEHRNKFSHVKDTGNYLQGKENELYAEILYSTLRVIITKHIRGELGNEEAQNE